MTRRRQPDDGEMMKTTGREGDDGEGTDGRIVRDKAAGKGNDPVTTSTPMTRTTMMERAQTMSTLFGP